MNINCNKPVLVRIHSECITGDVFGSHRCDCGYQLKEAIRKIDTKGCGVIIYLRQEGRGIGLYSKLDSYALQIRGVDTFKANEILGFKDDLRDYNDAVLMLKALRITNVELLTNNPDKIRSLQSKDIVVSKVIPTGVFLTECNKNYLQSKVDKKNHTIDIK
ncbi:GTP cyclohydrolase II RibA [Lonsdalea quercina]|uniref:GTP cyclohydrolase II RibA n=1 Tax=Lonsdalea quercina TaxID=71657 RepID=UPI0039764B4D